MTIAITKKIIGFSVAAANAGDEAKAADGGTAAPIVINNTANTNTANTNTANTNTGATEEAHEPVGKTNGADRVVMSEHISRPEVLSGRTYKISKSPANDNALYVTINDIVLNPGTPYEQRRPFEVFINSKNMAQFQWIVAVTRIMSAVFRKGGDVSFLVEEMKAIFDPNGGYWRPGGVFKNSLVAEIGEVIERHLKSIGMITTPVLDPGVAALVEEKRRLIMGEPKVSASAATQASSEESEGETQFPPSATLCPKCSTRARVLLDGCSTCLNCGDSKCG